MFKNNQGGIDHENTFYVPTHNTKQNLIIIKDHIMQCSQENSSAKTRIQRFKQLQVRIVNLDGSPNPTKIALRERWASCPNPEKIVQEP